MKGKVSVVIPTHNYAHTLGETLESVLAQSHPPCEILVVDDGSTDNTAEVLDAYGDRIRSIRREGRGAYGARNDSLEIVQGEYFLNVDADNRLAPDYIEKTLRLLSSSPPEIGYVYTQRRYFGDKEGVSDIPPFDPRRLPVEKTVDMGALIRMDLVKQFRFDERFNDGCGDQAFFLSLLQAGIHGILLDEPLLEYRVHGDSITGQVRRSYRQCRIQKRLLRTFPGLYPPEVARDAMADARNRTLVSIIRNRTPDAGLPQRLRDFWAFTRTNPRHAEWLRQAQYIFFPHLFR